MRFRCAPAALLCLLTAAAAAQSAPAPGAVSPAGLEQARAELAAGHLPQAEAGVRGFLAGHADSAAGHYLLAFILFREDKPVPSLAEYTRAAQIERPTSAQLQDVALDYVLANDYTDADKWMSVAVQWTPQDGEAWYSLGRIKYTENRFADAIACFNKALALMPRSVKAENNLGLAYEGLDRNTEALAAYRQAIAWQEQGTEAPSAEPYINLGTLLINLNQLNAAAPALEKAAALAPNNLRLCETLGKLEQRQGNLARAQAEFEHAVALSPQTASYHFLLGQIYRRTGQEQKAAAQFAEAAKLNGTHSSPE